MTSSARSRARPALRAFPRDRHYSPDDAWAREEGELVRVGITAALIESLDAIEHIELVEKGATLSTAVYFGTLSSSKCAVDLFAPCGGEVIAVNAQVLSEPKLLHADPYESGWLLLVKGTVVGLMNAAKYAASR